MSDMKHNDFYDEIEKMDEDEKLDFNLHDMEMLYRSRCVDVPLTTNVKVTEITKESTENPERDNSEDNQDAKEQ